LELEIYVFIETIRMGNFFGQPGGGGTLQSLLETPPWVQSTGKTFTTQVILQPHIVQGWTTLAHYKHVKKVCLKPEDMH